MLKPIFYKVYFHAESVLVCFYRSRPYGLYRQNRTQNPVPIPSKQYLVMWKHVCINEKLYIRQKEEYKTFRVFFKEDSENLSFLLLFIF
jgi:hypothetical protein